MLDVLMLGPVPPPFGGVAAHVERLRALLTARGLSVGILSHYSRGVGTDGVVGSLNRNPFRYWALTRRWRSRVVHYHHSHWSLLAAVALASLGDDRRYVATLHGHDVLHALRSRIPLVRSLTCRALGRFDAVVAVSSEVAEMVAHCVERDRIHVIPAFLSPESTSTVLPGLTSEAARFLEHGSPTLVVACSKLPTRSGATDVYGVDIAVRAFCALAPDRPRLKLVLFLGRAPRDRVEHAYLDALRAQVASAGLSDRFRLCIETALVPAFAYDVVYVRPTRTDGDAVSVREALSLGVPVVASDVVGRPDGTVLFSIDGGLEDVLVRVFEQQTERSTQRVGSGAKDTSVSDVLFEELLNVYGLEHAVR